MAMVMVVVVVVMVVLIVYPRFLAHFWTRAVSLASSHLILNSGYKSQFGPSVRLDYLKIAQEQHRVMFSLVVDVECLQFAQVPPTYLLVLLCERLSAKLRTVSCVCAMRGFS